MFFVYATILLAVFLVTFINIPLFKTTSSRYPSTDTIFYILLSLCYVALLERDVGDALNALYSTVTFSIVSVSMFVPIIYIVGLIGFWLVSNVRSIKLDKN